MPSPHGRGSIAKALREQIHELPAGTILRLHVVDYRAWVGNIVGCYLGGGRSAEIVERALTCMAACPRGVGMRVRGYSVSAVRLRAVCAGSNLYARSPQRQSPEQGTLLTK